jgi:hypothetical protein
MGFVVYFPRLVFLISFLLMWLAAWAGGRLNRRWRTVDEDLRSDFNVVQGATLTLLGLIIGFSFSMAIARYDQRKTYEEAEANAIGTEYVRADLLPSTEAQRTKDLLRRYTDLRIAFYQTREQDDLKKIGEETTDVQSDLWRTVSRPAADSQTPVMSLVVAGMNDVLNSQGYTQAAWWNRIPEAAWALMFSIAIFANAMLGYGARRVNPKLFVILPLVVAISFFLVADIDSPRRGVIRVQPQNLLSLKDTLH